MIRSIIAKVSKWCRKMDRFLWANELRVGCERALSSFFKGEKEVKEKHASVADYFEKDFREIERDHHILIYRTRKLESLAKQQPDEDFAAHQQDIHDKIKEVRDKFFDLTRRIREKE